MIDGEDSRLEVRRSWWLASLGRLKPGWTLAQATAQLETISPAVINETIPPVYDADSVKHYLRIQTRSISRGFRIFAIAAKVFDSFVDAAGDCRIGVGDCVREFGEFDVGAGKRAGKRNRGAAGGGRVARTADTATAFGEFIVGGDGRVVRRFTGARTDDILDFVSEHAIGSAVCKFGNRLASVGIYGRAGDDNVRTFWTSSCGTRDGSCARVGAESGGARADGGTRSIWITARPGGCASSAFAGAAGWGAAVCAELAELDHAGCGISARRNSGAERGFHQLESVEGSAAGVQTRNARTGGRDSGSDLRS